MIITTCKYCTKTRICDYDGGNICEDCHENGPEDWRHCDKCKKYEFEANGCSECGEEQYHNCESDYWDCERECGKIAGEISAHEDWAYSEAVRTGNVCEYCDAVGCSPERHERGY